MTKKSYFHFRITHEEKERWQNFADKEFDGAISKLVRASVTGFINNTVQTQGNEEILEILHKILTWHETQHDFDSEAGDIANIEDDPDEIIYTEVDKSSGKYDF